MYFTDPKLGHYTVAALKKTVQNELYSTYKKHSNQHKHTLTFCLIMSFHRQQQTTADVKNRNSTHHKVSERTHCSPIWVPISTECSVGLGAFETLKPDNVGKPDFDGSVKTAFLATTVPVTSSALE